MRHAALLVLVAAGITACHTGPRRGQSIRIASAVYSVQDGTVPCDVTSKVASTCNGLSSCSIEAHSRLCPMGDPAPTREKYLAVEYACGAGSVKAQVPQGKQLVLTCPP